MHRERPLRAAALSVAALVIASGTLLTGPPGMALIRLLLPAVQKEAPREEADARATTGLPRLHSRGPVERPVAVRDPAVARAMRR
jgi:hypothetical protein